MSSTVRVCGTVLRWEATTGTSKAGKQYRRITLRILVGDAGVCDVDLFSDSATFVKGQQFDSVCEVSVSPAGYLSISAVEPWPLGESVIQQAEAVVASSLDAVPA